MDERCRVWEAWLTNRQRPGKHQMNTPLSRQASSAKNDALTRPHRGSPHSSDALGLEPVVFQRRYGRISATAGLEAVEDDH